MALTYDVLVLDGTPRFGDMRLPTGEMICSSPLAVTMLIGDEEVFLVDAPYTYGQVARVRDWLLATRKKLAGIYITHAHGDHWLGAHELLSQVGEAPVYATPGTLELMHDEATAGRENLWDRVFEGLVPPSPVTAVPVPAEGLWVEGHELVPIELGHTDSESTTALWVPDLKLLVAGDSVYNGVHQYILETPGGGFDAWLTALDVLESLQPEAVVCGHKAPGAADDPSAIATTRDYLLRARDELARAESPDDYYAAMLRAYPARMNPGPVWYGALGLLQPTM